MRLERREGSFAKLIADIQDESLTAAVAIIGPNYPAQFLEQKIMDTGLASLTTPLLEYVLQCAGMDSDGDDTPTKSDAPPVSFQEHLASLYRVATGWMGWTPQVALDATPSEILEAYKGRIEMMKAIFGSADEPTPPINTDERFKTVLRSFGTTKIMREGAVQ